MKLNPNGRFLLYGTYLGGSNDDEARGIAVDSGGNAYITGFTRSSDFPTTLGAFDQTFGPGVVSDGFVTKLNPQGTGVGFSTFLGGSGNDDPLSIAVDNAGEAFVAGLGTGLYPLTVYADVKREAGVTRIEPSVVQVRISRGQ